MLNPDGNGIFLMKFNEALDIVLLWFIFYAWTGWVGFLAGIFVGGGMAICWIALYFYDKSLEECQCKDCKDKSHKRWLEQKYAPKISVEDQYWLSEKLGDETIIQTKNRILTQRQRRTDEMIKKHLERKKQNELARINR